MASVITNDNHYRNIARTLREKTNSEKAFLPSEMAQGIETVYETGKKKTSNEFWSSQQSEGGRKNCAFLYAGYGWNNETFKPEYDLQPTNAKSMFQYCHISNFKEHMESLGRKIDFSNSTNNDGVFHGCPYLKHLPEIDFSKSQSHINSFSWSGIEIIDLLKVSTKATFDRTFDGLPDLKEIRISGVIWNNINFASSPLLSTQSIISIFEALGDLQSGKSLMLNKTAVDNMDFTGTEYNSFDELRATKSRWTIVLQHSWE